MTNPTRDGSTRVIDWDEVRARLARNASRGQDGAHHTPEGARAVMDERARALARVPPQLPTASEVLEVAIFALADERYAVEACHIRKVVRLQELASVPGAVDTVVAVLTPVPCTPKRLVGVINYRGEILAVFDLRAFFGVAEGEVTDRSRVVVLGHERDEFGVLVDAAHEVVTLRFDDVHDPPGSFVGTSRSYLRGVTADGLIVLDGSAMLRDSRLIVDQGEEAVG